jgi:hypothetical protein
MAGGEVQGSGGGVLDTSVVISLPDITDPAHLPEDPQVAAITIAELSLGPQLTTDERVRQARIANLEAARAAFDPLPFDDDAADAFEHLLATLCSEGTAEWRTRSFDALIAATAVANGMPVYTCNPKDFERLDGVDVVAVPNPTRIEAP